MVAGLWGHVAENLNQSTEFGSQVDGFDGLSRERKVYQVHVFGSSLFGDETEGGG